MLRQELTQRKKNLVMGWINYQKAYDMVLYSWVIESLNMMGIAKNVMNFLEKTMKSWKMESTCGAEILREVTIKREILQGNALSLLLFVVALTPLALILRTYNPGYEFRTRETINYLLFMDDLKLYSKNERTLDSLIQRVRYLVKTLECNLGLINLSCWL